jgi:lipopolysaccharide biosynthesis glycosyltransferase
MKIVFCSDRGMLAALHVAAKSVLQYFQGKPEFVIITDELEGHEIETLRITLNQTSKAYALDIIKVDSKPFEKFPKLAGRHSTYFRLLIPDLIQDSRCLYLDSDIYCLCDLSDLFGFELSVMPLALVAEAPIEKSPDRVVFEMLGARAKGHYFNAGVSIINCAIWRLENIKSKCFEFISNSQPTYWDQSALNYVLHERIAEIPIKYNRHTNVRSNWPVFRPPQSSHGNLLHFVDSPKPWSAFGRWVHPLGKMWWNAYRETAHFQNGQMISSTISMNARVCAGYKKALKDKILYNLYIKKILTPKGVDK